jgi:hypothetical protein
MLRRAYEEDQRSGKFVTLSQRATHEIQAVEDAKFCHEIDEALRKVAEEARRCLKGYVGVTPR